MTDDVKKALEWAKKRTHKHRVGMSHVSETCEVCHIAALLRHIDAQNREARTAFVDGVQHGRSQLAYDMRALLEVK